MSDRRVHTANQLEALSDQAADLKSFVGLDGFVDEIFHVVDKRESADVYTRLPTIARFGERISNAAGKSANLELVSQRVKLGGNGPIMANALASFGLGVTYLGNLGYPNLHPVFEEFNQKASVHSIAEPGYTDALEFEDGKLMVGKHQALPEVNWQNLCARFGVDQLAQCLQEARLVCFVNWTMYTATNEIWEAIQLQIAPRLSSERRLLFIDLADPEKRTSTDICHALELIGNFQNQFEVILGLNEKESLQIAQVLALDISNHSPDALQQRAAQVREKIGVNTVVIHPVRFAVAADSAATALAEGPFTPKPLITTGAGDHFNAGFCLGRSLGLSNAESLDVGVGTSGFYVRHAKSPSLPDLIGLLRNWPAPE
jgi:sugar/nucleoside kinase (ribokinase family)